ncbi:unnamed protein product [Urochloa decumbens]|uniref:non-specific serine/threonine protein kinase n=1 Tax=Urochloa decumbens TaxID=240449 RepID=A0ABC9BAT5_9POAL
MAKPIHLLLLALTALVPSLPVSGASLQAAAGAGWPSPSGRFFFGFYATDGGLAVGIWLATAPNVTVTWTIDRNFTPATGGTLQITDDGRLLWAGANGQEYRNLAVPPQPAVAGAMRDDGNFVLYGADGAVVWSTFEAPRDTLLPGQQLGPGAQLFSSISDTNRATGKYRLVNQLNDGNIVMYSVQTPNVAAAAYWDTSTRVGRAATIALVCIGIMTCASIAALLAATRLFWASRRAVHRRLADADAEGLDALDEEAPLRSYRYKELEQATCSFREPLGRGAFGTVFRGSLHNGQTAIAVKRLEKVVEEGEREFQREVRAIGRTNHRNLVRLLGFCQEGANRLLVYEYMSNGSLAERLFVNRGGCGGGSGLPYPPSWGERMGIALDVARGLHYLHDELERRVIHCDVKPQNILMDASGTAKIADFGLAKLMLPDQTRTFTGVRGTRGYLAPEWYRDSGPLTVKADVYSYGVVLLETVTCRRSMELEEAGEDRTLMELAHEWLVGGEAKLVMASDEAVDASEVERAVKVALWCAQVEPQARPAMRTVILMLEGHLAVPFPPPPASS